MSEKLYFGQTDSFSKRVLEKAKLVSEGKVSTYGLIAAAAGSPKAARAAGNALSKNRRLVKIPCHRIVKADGSVGGYAGGSAEKRRLLEKEGILFKNGRIVGFKSRIFNFNKPNN